MHVTEESDRATVPMERLNKEGQPSLEVVEGRAWPEDNIARFDTFPTQSGRMRVPQVGRCAACSLPPVSEWGAASTNERPYGSVRGVLVTGIPTATKVRDQEAGGSNPLAPAIPFKTLTETAPPRIEREVRVAKYQIGRASCRERV